MRPIVAVRQDNNGDVILAGPAIRALARRGPVSLVCGPSGEPAARLLPGVADVVVARAAWIEGKLRPVRAREIDAFVARMRALAPSDAVIFTSFHQSPLPTALLLRLAGVPRIHAISVDYPGSLLDTRLVVDDGLHEVERALALARAAGFPADPADDGALRLRGPLPNVGHLVSGRYVVVQPGSTVAARRWAPEKMRALVAALAERVPVAVVGSADETLLCRFVSGASSALDLCGRTTFAEFAAVIAGAAALVVANTSGIHVAAATGTPTVSIFPPTIPPARFAPWHVPHVLLGNHAIGCAGCRARTCPVPGQPCIGEITPDDVLGALAWLDALPQLGVSA